MPISGGPKSHAMPPDGPVAALLFDKDGTLFDFHLSWSGWTAALIEELSDGGRARRLRVEEALRFDIASGRFMAGSPVIAGTPADIADALVPVLPQWSHPAMVAFLNARAAVVPMVPAVPLRPLLTRLRASGYRLGVATNASVAEAGAHLAAAGIGDVFDYVAGFDSGHGAKPGPGMCNAFARTLGLPASRIAMIGDSLHDLDAGRAAGMTTVAVLTGLAGHGDLAPHADVVLPDIGHLPDWLETRA